MIEKEIPIQKIEVGMELTSDVVNKYKQVLIYANTRFEEKHRFLLKTWGINSIKVKIENETEKMTGITEEQKAEAVIELETRMFWKPRNEIEKELVEIAVERICQKNSESK
jgi:hypothetical protein